jgi:hypothetical protein
LILVCCNGINPGDRSFLCPHNHLYCPQCNSDGCVLCQFRELKACNDKSYRDLSALSQRALYKCQIWENKFEETRQSKFSQYDKDNPSSMEYDNDSQNGSGSFFLKLH